MAFSAMLAGVMNPRIDLLEPLRPRRITLMAANAVAEVQFRKIDVRVIHMSTAWSVTDFTGKRLMLGFGQFQKGVRVTFVAGFHARKQRLARGDFLQRIATVVSVSAERGRGQKITRDKVYTDNAYGEEKKSGDLWAQRKHN